MRVLWLCNVPLPEIAADLGIAAPLGGGWLVGLSEALRKGFGVEMTVCFLHTKVRKVIKGKINGLDYYGISRKSDNVKLISIFSQIVSDVNPDIVHVFGSELPSALAMAKACEKLGIIDNLLLSIQGMVAIYAKHFFGGVPAFRRYQLIPKDLLKRVSIQRQYKDFVTRGKKEIEALSLLRNVSGRTDWDHAACRSINMKLNYHFCNEILRPAFYSAKWEIEKCERNSMFISQGGYPIKGLHYVIEALPIILSEFPDTVLYVGGGDLLKQNGILQRILHRTSYARYIASLIKRYKLEGKVVFTGPLDEIQMRDRMIKSHVFVSASTIENSPNSLGEAMILGLPCVSSYVGGVANMLVDKIEGLLYQHDAPYMLAFYVAKIFRDDALAASMGDKARAHASITHNREVNAETMFDIYQSLIG